MNTYRISKYKDNDLYTTWTSFSDIGRSYSGKIFTLNEYLRAEENHIACCMHFLSTTNTNKMMLTDIESYSNSNYKNYQILSTDVIKQFIRSCLREECWGKLTSKNLSIHFGYDYYIYICTDLSYEKCEEIVKLHNLNIELKNDPYWKGKMIDFYLQKVLAFLSRRQKTGDGSLSQREFRRQENGRRPRT